MKKVGTRTSILLALLTSAATLPSGLAQDGAPPAKRTYTVSDAATLDGWTGAAGVVGSGILGGVLALSKDGLEKESTLYDVNPNGTLLDAAEIEKIVGSLRKLSPEFLKHKRAFVEIGYDQNAKAWVPLGSFSGSDVGDFYSQDGAKALIDASPALQAKLKGALETGAGLQYEITQTGTHKIPLADEGGIAAVRARLEELESVVNDVKLGYVEAPGIVRKSLGKIAWAGFLISVFHIGHATYLQVIENPDNPQIAEAYPYQYAGEAAKVPAWLTFPYTFAPLKKQAEDRAYANYLRVYNENRGTNKAESGK